MKFVYVDTSTSRKDRGPDISEQR
jgi:guanylate kinase